MSIDAELSREAIARLRDAVTRGEQFKERWPCNPQDIEIVCDQLERALPPAAQQTPDRRRDVIERRVALAEPVGDRKALPAILHVTETIPHDGNGYWDTSEAARDFYDEQARKIVDVLDALPRGTRDALLVQLLDDKRSELRT